MMTSECVIVPERLRNLNHLRLVVIVAYLIKLCYFVVIVIPLPYYDAVFSFNYLNFHVSPPEILYTPTFY